MISKREAGIALALLLLPAASFGAIDCRKALKPTEHLICTSPALRAADAAISSHYATARVALAEPLATELVKSQRAWLAKRNADCVVATCLSALMAARDTILSALIGQVSDANPTLPSLHAVWLEGVWKIGPQSPSTLISAGDFPEEGSAPSFRAGEYCEMPSSCTTFGLEAHTLDDGSVPQTMSTRLLLKSNNPFYLVYRFGKSSYILIPLPDGTLLALSDGCAKGGKPCGEVKQVWRPAGPESRVREADLSKQ